MEYGIRHTVLFLVVMAFFFSPLAKAGCGGACAISGGASYDFMGDRAVNMDMSSFDDFIRENLRNNQTTMHAKSLGFSNVILSLSQNASDDSSQNATKIEGAISSSGNSTSNNRIVKLSTSSKQEQKSPTMAPTTPKSFMF